MFNTRKLCCVVGILFVIILSLSVFYGCDNTTGPSKNVDLANYRYADKDWFNLPIKVQNSLSLPDPKIRFKSRLSLEEICESLNRAEDYYAEFNYDNSTRYVLAKDKSDKNLGYCLIYKEYFDEKFNYVVTNMECRIYSAKSKINGLGYLIPMHLLVTSSIIGENLSIIEGLEYKTSASIDDFANFYRGYDFEVTIEENKLLLEDKIGKGGDCPFDGIASACEIQFEDGVVRYMNFTRNNQSYEMQLINLNLPNQTCQFFR